MPVVTIGIGEKHKVKNIIRIEIEIGWLMFFSVHFAVQLALWSEIN